MTRSRKLILAAALLAGGYGLALVASGLSDFLWARRLIDGTSASLHGGNARSGDESFGAARLVPQTPAATAQAEPAPLRSAAAATAASQRAHAPTWLPPVLQASWDPSTSGKQGDAAVVAASHTAETADEVDGTALEVEAVTEAKPRARLTNVKRSATIASVRRSTDLQGQSTSPWDRWPRWEPPTKSITPATQDDSQLGTAAIEPAPTTGPTDTIRAAAVSSNGGHDFAADETGALRTHIVVDGDCLSRLADRYLDDPELGDAIFQLNRDVLTDPELLPIGAELRIPERRMASSSRVGPPVRDDRHRADSAPAADDGRQPASKAPRAQLLGPRPPTAEPVVKPSAFPTW